MLIGSWRRHVPPKLIPFNPYQDRGAPPLLLLLRRRGPPVLLKSWEQDYSVRLKKQQHVNRPISTNKTATTPPLVKQNSGDTVASSRFGQPMIIGDGNRIDMQAPVAPFVRGPVIRVTETKMKRSAPLPSLCIETWQ